MSKKNYYNLIIIGAGPAGLAASIYASRYALKHLIIGNIMGGQISETHLIDNYPGIEDATGIEFSQKWVQHVKKYGTEILADQVKSVKKNEKSFWEINTENGKKITAQTLLLATGTKRIKMNLPQEDKFIGKGVSYCATCDGFFYKDKIVGVVGGSDSAVGAALYLADIAQKVYLIYRQEKLRCEPYWDKLVTENQKIKVLYKTKVVKLKGDGKLEAVELDKDNNKKEELLLDGLFIEIGSVPNIDYIKNINLETDEGGYVKIKKDSATSIKSIWAAGDLTNGSNKFRQVITAASEGVIAVKSISEWLKKRKEK